MAKNDNLADAHSLWVLLNMTRDAIFRSEKEELSQYKVTPIRIGVMFLIKSLSDKATLPELSRYILRKRHTISELLTRMEQAGLIKKIHDHPEKNPARYEVTEKGNKLYLVGTKLKTIERNFSHLSKEQRQQLRSLLDILFKAAITSPIIDINAPQRYISEE